MMQALALSLGQLADPRTLRLLVRSIVITILFLAAFGALAWWGLDRALGAGGLADTRFTGAGSLREAIALAAVLIGGWLLWRVIALAVLQFHADAVIEAVEAKYYPEALAGARALGWRGEAAAAWRGTARAIGWNSVALPFALALTITGVGTAILFWAVNAIQIGRELTELVWLRQRHRMPAMPLGPAHRFALGGVVVALLTIPFVNLLAPFLGAAMATHLVYRKGISQDAA
jgi:uncharacterized protein involved in cysteine biosynthesis